MPDRGMQGLWLIRVQHSCKDTTYYDLISICNVKLLTTFTNKSCKSQYGKDEDRNDAIMTVSSLISVLTDRVV